MKNESSKYYTFKSIKPKGKALRLVLCSVFGIFALVFSCSILIISIIEKLIFGVLGAAGSLFMSFMIFKEASLKKYGVYLLEDRLEFDMNPASRFLGYGLYGGSNINIETKTVYYREIQNFYTENMTEKNKFIFDSTCYVLYPGGKAATRGECVILVAESEKQDRRNVYCFSVENQEQFLEVLQNRFTLYHS